MTGFLLPLDGPMQSWADTGFGQLREAGPFPSRAAVLGIVAAALGVERGDARLVWLHDTFRVHIAQARAGRVLRDFHTVETNPKKQKTLTWRDYHHDARFAALVEADDSAAVSGAIAALRRPVYTAFLGRRSCPPAHPLLPVPLDAAAPERLAALAAFADDIRHDALAERTFRHVPAPVALFLDGHHAEAPSPFEGASVSHGTRRDRLAGAHRSYVSRPFTRLVAPRPDSDTFDALL